MSTSSRFAAIFSIVCLLATATAYGQYFNWVHEPEPVSNYDVNVTETPKDYSATYWFGDSDGSWSLTVKASGKNVAATYSYSVYNEKTSSFDDVVKTIRNAKIEGFVFLGEGFLGTFMLRRTTRQKVLVLVKGYTADSPEVGLAQVP
ncbi:MAG: hypothetical protein SGJ05_01795 [bacterium]|nr:hypothetical protein [bacterium]